MRKPTGSLRVSRATMQREIGAIARRHFREAFDEICAYYGQVNPRGHSYVPEYLRAMRDQLEWHEAGRRQTGRGSTTRMVRRAA